MNASRNQYSLAGLALALCLSGPAALGVWQDQTSGRPLVLSIFNKELSDDTPKWLVLEDKLGRLFVGSDKLHVFDGESWQSYPVPDTSAVRALAFGEEGRLWTGALDEVGYFEEASVGAFKYHSLLGSLPETERKFGIVWACATLGRNVFFFCRNKVLGWDGAVFRLWTYPGESRLFPLKLGDEPWFHDMQTGLYRMTPNGPQLEVPAAQLPSQAILGLARDKHGLVLATDLGLFRPGTPSACLSDAAVNTFIKDAKLSCFAALPQGGYALGTLYAGMALVAEDGSLVRALNPDDGLPSRMIHSIMPNVSGFAWCTTSNGIFRIEITGRVTVYDSTNGLQSRKISDFGESNGRLYAATDEGVFRLISTPGRSGRFEPLPALTKAYISMLPLREGLLVGRQSGMDYYDGHGVAEVATVPANSISRIQASRVIPARVYYFDIKQLNQLSVNPDGSFSHQEVVKLPIGYSLYEDQAHKLQLGTAHDGAFIYDPDSAQLTPVLDPVSKQALSGYTYLMGNDRRILYFNHHRILEATSAGRGLSLLAGLPSLELSGYPVFIPGTDKALIAFTRAEVLENSATGLGILDFDPTGKARWQELDVPALAGFGSIDMLKATKEDHRLVVWLGGAEGLLRQDFESLQPVQRPDPPLIRVDASHSSRPKDQDQLAFAFRDHRVSLRLFTGDYSKGRSWLFQTRLGSGSEVWDAPTARRSFEFSNLSEGDYRFEARAVNSSGLTSEPTVLTFRILPPWYRSAWAYAGYVGLFASAVFLLIRVRERQTRIRNQELEKTVALRTEELVKASAAKDEFLAGISHEIRNPMNGVIGIAETFRTDALDAEGRHKFGLLRQCATHLSSLLEDILDYSRVQAGMVELEPKPFDLAEITEAIAAITATESEKRGIPVEIAVSPAVPARLIGDARRIRQILLNFVANALKFSGRGQVSVTIWCKTAGPAKTEVIFAVSDEGPGISPEEQKRLFTRFERGAAAQQGRVPGTGLGLALCKGLAEKMGGRIWLESEPGEGSCFYFSAPFAIPEDTTAAETDPSLADLGRGQIALVVDDEEYNRIALTDLLETLGFTVHSAADGLAALALAGKRDFDFAFLDYDLPGMSGLDTSRGLRALPNASARARIIATTAFTTQDKRNQCIAAGMDTFLSKPVTLERLRKVLTAAPTEGVTPTRPMAATPRPADPLANLRLITLRKGSSFEEELALYLSEFEVELENLRAALQEEDSANSGHYAHLLYGRSAFIAETQLEQALRKIEKLAAGRRWPEARTLLQDAQGQMDGLRLRLVSAGSAAQPGSGR